MKRNGLVENPVTWTSKYGSLVIASFPEKGKACSSDGINEKGLAANFTVKEVKYVRIVTDFLLYIN